MKVVTGRMPFQGFETYYRIVGEKTDLAPLLLIHGGPGSTHNYFEVLDSLAETSHRQIISYDQIGCGESYVEGHKELWSLRTWTAELIALRQWLHLDRVHLLGQSWGGMLIMAYLIDCKPEGVESVILSSTLSSSALWSHEQQRLIAFMPVDEQKAIAEAVRTGNFEALTYLKANEHYTALYADEITADSPECLRRKKRFGLESYIEAWAPTNIHRRERLKTSTIPPVCMRSRNRRLLSAEPTTNARR